MLSEPVEGKTPLLKFAHDYAGDGALIATNKGSICLKDTAYDPINSMGQGSSVTLDGKNLTVKVHENFTPKPEVTELHFTDEGITRQYQPSDDETKAVLKENNCTTTVTYQLRAPQTT